MAVHQGAKADCEMPVARELLESVQSSLDNAAALKLLNSKIRNL